MLSRLPETMIAIEIASPGGPENLRPTSRAVPHPGSGEVLIRVRAAGVNRADLLQRQGKYPPPPGASDIPGLEVAGEIVAVGYGVSEYHAEDEVCALLSGGGYAEYVVVPAAQCLPIPEDMDMVTAAALPETFFTVWHNVFERGLLQRGETLLVHGGSGGIGTTAIQMATAFGAKVYTTAGSDEKCRMCEELGAMRAINHETEDFVAVIKKETKGRGVDVILDMVGGDYIPRNLQALANDGRLVNIAFMHGSTATINFGDILARRLTITGSTLRARSIAQKSMIGLSLHENAWALIEDGLITPVIHTTFPLDQAAAAHELMENSAHFGKIVLTT